MINLCELFTFHSLLKLIFVVYISSSIHKSYLLTLIFNLQTIATISVEPRGVIQFGSTKKVVELKHQTGIQLSALCSF